MEHDTFGFQVPGDEENGENNEVLYIPLFHLSTIFFCVIALAQPYENDHLVFMRSLKMSFPSFFPFFFFFVFKGEHLAS